MSYTSRLIVNLTPADAATSDAARTIAARRGGTIVDGRPNCLACSTETSLVTVIGHGTDEGTEISVSKDGATQLMEGDDLADHLKDYLGLRAAQMITLVSCSASMDVCGLAGELHSALKHGSVSVTTNLNARTARTVVIEGQQWVAGETGYYREKIGTKRLYFWDHEGDQQSRMVTEGYTQDGVRIGPERVEESPNTPDATSSAASSSSYKTFDPVRSKKKDKDF